MKIVIAGNYGAGNIGDEMILKGLLETLTNISPSLEITILSGNPEETKFLYNIKSEKKVPSGIHSLVSEIFDRKSQTRKTIKECDYFILGGGGLFAGPKKRANIIWGIQALMAYIYKKPVIIYGQSIGEMRSSFEKWIIKKVFEKAKLIVLRDSKSAERIKSLGIKQEIHIIPDMAFAIDNQKPTEERKEIVLVALRQIDSLVRDFKVSVAEFIDWLTVEKRFSVKIVNLQDGEAGDKIINEGIKKLIEHMENVEYIEKITDQKIFELFNEAKIILGMRFHSIIYAIKTLTPFIAISYAPKIKDLLSDMGLKSYMLEVEEVSLDKLKQKFIDVMTNYDQIKKLEEKYNSEAKEKHKKMTEILSEILL